MSGYVQKLSVSTLDAQALRANDNVGMIGCLYMHARNQRLYRVISFEWNGDNDLWMVRHRREGSPVDFVRSLANFNGCFDGTEERRFIQILEDK